MSIQNRPSSWLTPETAALIAIGLFVSLNLSLAALMVINKAFNPDELQHLHIAWSISRGEVIYRDFWEHHGPLFSLLNGTLIYLFDPAPSLRILFLSRLLSLAATTAMLGVVWSCARQLSLSRIGAFLAVAVCTSFYFVLNKGGEMRPDPLQALFWTGGVLMLLINQSNGKLRHTIMAGALFVLAVMSNAKAGIGPFFVGAFYLSGWLICGLSWSDFWRDMRGMLTGAGIALLPFIAYFGINNALGDFLYFNYVWNVLLNYYWSTIWQGALDGEESGVTLRNWQFFVDNQLPALLLAGAGFCFWLNKIRRSEDQASKQRNWLFLIVTAGTSLGWLLNQHSQFFLMFLPFWSVIISFGLTSIANVFGKSRRDAGVVLSSALAVIAAIMMLRYSLAHTTFTEDALLQNQKRATSAFVNMSERDEPVGILWNQCGGYMFNPHVSFYWVAMPYISEVIEKIDGEHPFDENFIGELESQQVRYVIGMQEWMTGGLSDKAFNYLQDNYDYASCLWTRKNQ